MASYNSTSSSLDSLRKWLNDIIGSHSAEIFSDDFLGSYLRQFGGRVDAVQCALESLIEEYYNEANQQMNNICPTDLLDKKPEKPIEFFKLPFFKRVRLHILIKQLHRTRMIKISFKRIVTSYSETCTMVALASLMLSTLSTLHNLIY